MTVEAALIIPIVLCIFVIAIYASWFLYDRCLFTQDVYLACLRESYRKEAFSDSDGGRPEVHPERIESDVRKMVGQNYFALSHWEGRAGSDRYTGTYQGTARVAPTVFTSSSIMPRGIWDMAFSAESRKADTPWMIRSYRRKSYMVTKGIDLVKQIGEENE